MCHVMEKVMNRIKEIEVLNQYILKFNIDKIFKMDLIEAMELHYYEKAETILKMGSELEYYYLLVDGKIKISYIFENGNSVLLKFYKPLNTIGDLEIINSLPVTCEVEAMKDTYLIAISAKFIKNNYLEDTKFLKHLVKNLSKKLQATINNTSYNFTYPLVNRLSSYLLEYVNENGYVILSASFIEIAQFLGTTYRHLRRTIKELEGRKIIEIHNKEIHVINMEELKKLSHNLYSENNI